MPQLEWYHWILVIIAAHSLLRREWNRLLTVGIVFAIWIVVNLGSSLALNHYLALIGQPDLSVSISSGWVFIGIIGLLIAAWFCLPAIAYNMLAVAMPEIIQRRSVLGWGLPDAMAAIFLLHFCATIFLFQDLLPTWSVMAGGLFVAAAIFWIVKQYPAKGAIIGAGLSLAFTIGVIGSNAIVLHALNYANIGGGVRAYALTQPGLHRVCNLGISERPMLFLAQADCSASEARDRLSALMNVENDDKRDATIAAWRKDVDELRVRPKP